MSMSPVPYPKDADAHRIQLTDPRPSTDVSGGPDICDSAVSAASISPDQLLSLVEGELLPRLWMNCRRNVDLPAARPAMPTGQPWPEDTVANICTLASCEDDESLDLIVNTALDNGADVTQVFLELLGPAAKELGEDWLADRASFIDVHLGLLSLRRLVGRFEGFVHARSGAGRDILLTTAPGDDHSFGITLVADCFQRAGWRVCNLTGASLDELVGAVADNTFNCVGLSLYNDSGLDDLRQAIADIRVASRNPDIVVVVGGVSFENVTEPTQRVGADLYLTEARDAVEKIGRALGLTGTSTHEREGLGARLADA